jgi:hypothetical protein
MEVAPTEDVGVIVPEGEGLIYRTMRWGLIPSRAKDEKIGNSLINARVEGIATKPASAAPGKTVAVSSRRQASTNGKLWKCPARKSRASSLLHFARGRCAVQFPWPRKAGEASC